MHRVKYAIQGGLLDKLLDEEMTTLVAGTSKKVRDQVDKLSEFTHITERVLYGKKDVGSLPEETLNILLELLKSIEVARKSFARLTLSKITTEIVDRKIELQAYRATEGIPEIHTFRAFAIKDVEIRNINEQAMLFYAYGDLFLGLVEEDSTDEEEYANQPEVMIPYNSTLVAGIPDSFEELDLEICEFNLDMEKAVYYTIEGGTDS